MVLRRASQPGLKTRTMTGGIGPAGRRYCHPGLSAFVSRRRGLGILIALTCAGFGTGLTLFAGSPHLWFSPMLLVPVGFCFMLPIACSNIVMQTVVPDALRGG